MSLRSRETSQSKGNSDINNYPTDKVYSGPGGNYLSNEIFYRVAKLRDKFAPNLKTGHFHVAQIQEVNDIEKKELNTEKIANLLFIVKNSLKEGIKGI